MARQFFGASAAVNNFFYNGTVGPGHDHQRPQARNDRQNAGGPPNLIDSILRWSHQVLLDQFASVARVWFRFALSALGTAVLPPISFCPSVWMLWNVCRLAVIPAGGFAGLVATCCRATVSSSTADCT